MLHTTYAIWGLVIVGCLAATWMIRVVFRRIRHGRRSDSNRLPNSEALRRTNAENQALMFLMTQKTDSVLAALSRTIEQERQKLGIAVSNSSQEKAAAACRIDTTQAENTSRSGLDCILPMARQGMSEGAIARQLHLPETEVAMVMRFHAA